MVLAAAAYLNCKSLREFGGDCSVPSGVEFAMIEILSEARLTYARFLTKVMSLGRAATKIF